MGQRALLRAVAAPGIQEINLECLKLHRRVIQATKGVKVTEQNGWGGVEASASQFRHQSSIKLLHLLSVSCSTAEKLDSQLAPPEGAISTDSSSQQIPDIPRPLVPNKHGLCNSPLARTPRCS